MSHIPNKAIPHATAADPAPPKPADKPLTRGDWLTLGGIAALVGIGAAGLGSAAAGLFRKK